MPGRKPEPQAHLALAPFCDPIMEAAMTKPRLPPAGMPDWPRWLTTDLAAAYVGASETKFREEVDAGLWPLRNPKLGR